MNRRAFLTALGGTTIAWPRAGRAQQNTMPVIGFLATRGAADDPQLRAAYRDGLKQAGYAEGRNVAIEYRFAENEYGRLPGLAADLVQRQVALIQANGPAATVAKAATSTIPIVFTAGRSGRTRLVASLNRPAGNTTGVTSLDDRLGSKRLEILHEITPAAKIVAALLNLSDPARNNIIAGDMQTAARALGLELRLAHASVDADFENVFQGFPERAVSSSPGTLFLTAAGSSSAP